MTKTAIGKCKIHLIAKESSSVTCSKLIRWEDNKSWENLNHQATIRLYVSMVSNMKYTCAKRMTVLQKNCEKNNEMYMNL